MAPYGGVTPSLSNTPIAYAIPAAQRMTWQRSRRARWRAHSPRLGLDGHRRTHDPSLAKLTSQGLRPCRGLDALCAHGRALRPRRAPGHPQYAAGHGHGARNMMPVGKRGVQARRKNEPIFPGNRLERKGLDGRDVHCRWNPQCRPQLELSKAYGADTIESVGVKKSNPSPPRSNSSSYLSTPRGTHFIALPQREYCAACKSFTGALFGGGTSESHPVAAGRRPSLMRFFRRPMMLRPFLHGARHRPYLQLLTR